jgi:hypothetical protein
MRSLNAIAIVRKKNPKLSVLEIYSSKDDVKIGKDEMIIKVLISPIYKKSN